MRFEVLHRVIFGERPGLPALVGFAWTEKRRLVLASLCMGICAVATAGYAFLVGPVLRSFFGGDPPAPLSLARGSDLSRLAAKISALAPAWIGVAIIAVAALKGLAYFGQNALSGQAGQRVLHKMRLCLYENLLSLNPLEREAAVTGELISRFTVDVEELEKSISQGLMAWIRDILQIVCLAAVAIALDPLMGLAGLLVFPPVAGVIVRYGRRIRKRRAEVHRAFGALSTAVEESANGLQVIRAFRAGPIMRKRFRLQSGQIYRSAVRAIVIKAQSSPLNEVMAASALAATLWLSHRRIGAGEITPEAFVSFFSALLLLYQPIKGIGVAQHAIQSGLAALERLPGLPADLGSRSEGPEVEPEEGGGPLQKGVTVELREVSASYSNGEAALEKASLVLRRGSRVAVVGRSGAGKTSLLRLLQGFLKSSHGEVLIDGRPVSLDPELASCYFSPVGQEPFLFDDTIRMNVLSGNRYASEEDVERVCQIAGVRDFAIDLPRRLDFVVGPGGRNISFGQRQRICLARALISHAPVLLLDEVTASLDGQTEEEIIERVEGALGDRTIVLVTHRLATACWADEVIFIDGSRVRFQGKADDLTRGQPELRQIFGAQSASHQDRQSASQDKQSVRKRQSRN